MVFCELLARPLEKPLRILFGAFELPSEIIHSQVQISIMLLHPSQLDVLLFYRRVQLGQLGLPHRLLAIEASLSIL